MVSRLFSPRDLRLFFATLSLLLTAHAQAGIPPNAPTALGAAVRDSAGTVYLSFDDNATDETNFDVAYTASGGSVQHYSVTTGDGNNTTATKTGTGNVIIAVGLSPSTTYTFQVAAYSGLFNPGNTSAYTNTITVITTSFGTPAISTLTTPNETTVRFVVVDNASSEAGYFYEFNSGGVAFTSSPNVSNLPLSGFAPGTTYQFRIRGFQGTAATPTAYTPYSNVASVTTPFNAPTGLAVTTASNGTMNLTWADNSAAEHAYGIYYRTSGSGTYTLLTYTAANATSYAVTTLAPGIAYDFQVAAAYQSTTVIESARSNTATAAAKDNFTSRTYQPITYNQAFSYQAVTSTTSSRTSWNITGLPTGVTFNSGTGLVSGTPTVTGVFACPMTASFANGWTATSTLTLRVIRAAGLPLVGTTITGQSLASGNNTSVSLTGRFSDPDSESAVRIVTNKGTMDFILYNTATPQTVTNFLSYVNNASSTGNYNGAVFHRSVPGFIVQGGGFKVQSAPNNFTAITTTASPTNEPGISNLRGTVAMAKVGTDPNSATDQFFVNLADNSSNLDNQNGGFTAFARVAGGGMTVADAMAALPIVANPNVNVNGVANTSLTDWPVISGTTMDTSKVVTITSAAPVAVLSYSITGNTNSSAVSASISGTNVNITGSSGGQSDVTVSATDLDGNIVSQTFTVTVSQAPLITSTAPSAGGTVGAAYNFNYTASGFPAPTFSATGLPPGLSLSSTGVISGTATTAGTFTGTVTATNPSGTNPQGFNITIAKATGIVTLGSLAQTYNGTARVATATTTPAGKTVTFTYDGSSTPPTNAGTYVVVATINDANYTGTDTQNLVVAKASGSVSLGSLAQTYDGTARVATATTTPSGKTVSFTYDGSSTAPTNAGTYSVVGTIVDTNYTGSSAPQNLVVSKALATLALGSLAQTYDGTARVATATTTPAGKTVTFTYDGSSTPPTNAGTYVVVGTIVDGNYAGSSAPQNLVVAKAAATVTLGSLAQTYDGTARVATATTTPSGKTVTFTYSGSSTPPTNAGSYTVVGTINDTNYAGTDTQTLVVAKAAASVTLGSLAQTYDGTARIATATTTPSGKTVTFTYDGLSTPPTNAGSYAVVGTISDTNYAGTDTKTLVVAKASGSVALGSLAQTYDGTARVATATTTPSGKTVTFTYNGLSTPPTNAGTYAVVGTMVDGNYTATDAQNLVVAKAAASVTLGNLSQSFDGSPKSVTATTTPVGLAVSVTYNGSSSVPSAQGSYSVLATITDTNYTPSSQSGTLIIGGQSASSWKTQHFTAGQISSGMAADNADPDGDGVKNFVEYALGSDPLSRSSVLPQPTVDGSGLTLTFTRPKGLPDVTYAAESTDSLGGTWTPVTLQIISDDGQVQTVRARDTLATGNPSRRFMRLIFGVPAP